MRERQVWTGELDSVAYEVSLHGVDQEYNPRGTWCGYVLIVEGQVPDDVFENLWLDVEDNSGTIFAGRGPTYDYYASAFNDFDWHGGITFYGKKGGLDGAKRLIKVGCDYNHYFDEGHYYTKEMVEVDLHGVIREMKARWEFKLRCPWDGKWFSRSAGVNVNGKIWSAKGLIDQDGCEPAEYQTV